MKGIFLRYPVQNLDNHIGIRKKMAGQLNVFNSEGLNCQFVDLKTSKNEISNSWARKLNALPFTNVWPYWNKSGINTHNCNYIYFRRPSAINKPCINFLRCIKIDNHKTKVIMEIPTYPYDEEYVGVKKLLHIKDMHNRVKLKGLVDRIVVVGYGQTITELWGIPVIQIDNGCDMTSYKIKEENCVHNSVTLICVAMFSFWHGYERLIKGLAEYKNGGGETDYRILFVGDGPELSSYIELSNKLDIKNKVEFLGTLSGDQLNKAYNRSDIAVGSLGLYKKNIDTCSTLKASEAFAKGMPIIVGNHIKKLSDDNFKYYLEFNNDSSPIDFNRIDDFVVKNHIKDAFDKNSKLIRRYAEDNYSSTAMMSDVIRYIKEG